jgi:hypothetical protein
MSNAYLGQSNIMKQSFTADYKSKVVCDWPAIITSSFLITYTAYWGNILSLQLQAHTKGDLMSSNESKCYLNTQRIILLLSYKLLMFINDAWISS